jgi:hypothetical protein
MARLVNNLIAFSMSILMVSFAHAQTDATIKKKPLKKQESNAKDVSKTSLVNFSMRMLEGNAIDPKYVGSFAEEIALELEKTTALKKGEFESTAEFTARKEAASPSMLLGNTLAFVMPVTRGSNYSMEGINYKFDADTGAASLYFLPTTTTINGIGGPHHSIYRGSSMHSDSFIISSKVRHDGTYQGTNAYGASLAVEKTHIFKVGIASTPIPFLTFPRNQRYVDPTYVAQIYLENSSAAAELPVLKALVVLELSEPYILYNFEHFKPKINSPSDMTVVEKYLTGNVLGVIYYSGLNGQILARVPAKFGTAGFECSQLHEQYVKAQQQRDDAVDEKGVTGSNAARLLFWPLLVSKYLDINDAIKTAEFRMSEVVSKMSQRQCELPAN